MTLAYDGFHSNQNFTVPLHDNDLEYTRITTGLKRVHADRMPAGFIDYMTVPSRLSGYPSNWPVPTYDDAIAPSVNGCPTSMGAHRTLQIDEVGEYFLETGWWLCLRTLRPPFPPCRARPVWYRPEPCHDARQY